MKVRPAGDTIIILPDPIERYQGSIILPEKNSEEKISQFARVAGLGPDYRGEVKVGDRILYARFFDHPSWYEEDGKKYRFIKEHYILGVLC